ncbi:MAG TPA: hypothetical protein PKY96_09455 [Flavobacteriales bacterium]|nr:hypothetical protein [Flavobacteriales bacterium]
MLYLLKQTSIALARFATWFDARFGWFFTNGMKDRNHQHQQPLKA